MGRDTEEARPTSRQGWLGATTTGGRALSPDLPADASFRRVPLCTQARAAHAVGTGPRERTTDFHENLSEKRVFPTRSGKRRQMPEDSLGSARTLESSSSTGTVFPGIAGRYDSREKLLARELRAEERSRCENERRRRRSEDVRARTLTRFWPE